MAQQIKKKFIAPDAIDGSKIKLQEGEALRLQTPGGVVELLKKDADGNLVSEGNEISFKADMETAVSAEESARIAAVSAEASARMAADSSLEVKIDFIASNIDGTAVDSITELLSAFQSADGDLNNAISQLAGAAGGNLSAEIVARESAISAEASARTAADLSLQSALSVETAAREAAVSAEIVARESAISAEESARMAAVSAEESARMAAVSAEIVARESADEDLQDQIDTEKGRIDAILLAADADKDSFAEIVSLINSVDTENDNAFAAAVLSLQSADTAEASLRAAEDLTFLKLNGSRSMTGNLSMGGGAPVLQTQTKNVVSGITGTRQSILVSQTNAFGTQSGGDYDGQDYFDMTLTQEQYDNIYNDMVVYVSDVSNPNIGLTQTSVIQKEVLDAENASYRFYLGAGVISNFTEPFELTLDFKSAPKVSISFPGLLNNGFDATQESFKLELITSGNFFSGVYTKITLATFVGAIDGGSWTFIDPSYISGTPSVNSSGLIEYFEADSLTSAFGLQRLYVFTEKVLVSSSFKITNLANGTLSTDAANYGQVLGVSFTASNIQNELNTTQTGAGLSSTGTYVPNMMSNFIGGATSLSNADVLLDNALFAEQSARQDAVSAEESARMTADSSLEYNLSVETAARESAISAEESARMAAVSAEESARMAAVSAEESARMAAVSAEESARMAADSSLQSELDATQLGTGLASDGSYISEPQITGINTVGVHYIMNATDIHDATKILDANLKNESNTLSASISWETSSRQSALSVETSARESAISAEASARIAGDQSLQSQINNVLSNIDPAALDSLTEIVSAFQSADSDLNNAISQLAGAAGGNLSAEIVARESAISAEASARIAADLSLESALSVETAAREAAVSTEVAARESAVSAEIVARESAISAEASARMAADESLESDLSVEIAARESAVSAEASARTVADESLESALSVETAARESAISAEESARMAAISAEIVARESAVDELETYDLDLRSDLNEEISIRAAAISAEESARTAADLSLESALSVEVAARESADTAEASLREAAVSTEVAARESADLSLQSALSVEIAARESAVSAEIVARESADEDLQDQIDTEKGRIDAILLAADADKDSFAEIVSLINSVDTENDNAFAAAVLSLQSADTAEASARIAAVSAEIVARESAVSAEESARMAADESLESNLSVEVAARESAVSAEASARTAADLSLESVIDNLDGYAQDLRSDLDAEESARIAEDLTFFKKDGSREMTGSIIPSVDVSFDLGSSSKRFRDLYLSGNTIDLGGVTLSNESSEFVVRDASNNELAIVSDNIKEGSVNKFFTESRVQETEMSMLDVTKTGEVDSTDSLIDAVSKLQSQITQEISDREDDISAEASARAAAVSAEASARTAADGMLDMRLLFIEGQVLESDLMFEVGQNGVTTSSIVLPHIASKIYKVCVGRLNVFKNVDYTIGTEMVMNGPFPTPRTKLTWIGDLASGGVSAVAEGDKIFISYLYNG
jgi:hypothetical protein